MNAPPSGLPNPDPFALISRLCLRLASPILLIAFVLQLSGMGDLPDSRRVFDLGATHRQIMDHQCGHPSRAIYSANKPSIGCSSLFLTTVPRCEVGLSP